MSRVPPHASGGPDVPAPVAKPAPDELEQLEELGDDAIIAQQTAAHVPKPRAQVTEDARSVVITEPPVEVAAPAQAPAAVEPPQRKRSERNEKTVVIRDRRQLDELRVQILQRKAGVVQSGNEGVWVWIAVGVAAFVTGCLAALFFTRGDAGVEPPASTAAAVSSSPSASPPPSTSRSVGGAIRVEPPSVSIDALPVEGSRQQQPKP